jgi:hypothetical protein
MLLWQAELVAPSQWTRHWELLQWQTIQVCCDDLSHETFFFVFLDFVLHVLGPFFSKSKGQVISHVMCHVQVM